jgi:hypothetical protein
MRLDSWRRDPWSTMTTASLSPTVKSSLPDASDPRAESGMELITRFPPDLPALRGLAKSMEFLVAAGLVS